jgi:hypothetical protein
LKHQTVDIAHGITIDMHGPMSLRRNDLTVLRESKIVYRLQAIQLGHENQYVLFGNSAYKKQSHLTSYFKDDTQIEEHAEWNKRLKHVRISIEWIMEEQQHCTSILRIKRSSEFLHPKL